MASEFLLFWLRESDFRKILGKEVPIRLNKILAQNHTTEASRVSGFLNGNGPFSKIMGLHEPIDGN